MFVMFQNRNVKRCFTFYNLWLFVCLSCLCLCLPCRRLDNGHTRRSGALLCGAVLVRCDRAPERIIAKSRKNKIFLNRMMILKMPRAQGRAKERWGRMKWLAGNISRQRCFSIHKELGIFLESRHQAIFSSNSNLELLTLLKRGSCVKNISFQLCQPNSSSPLSL